jgi:hypothetical protein
MSRDEKPCRVCGPEVSRRDFMKTAAGAAVAASLVRSTVAWADLRDDAPEKLVKAFHKSLTDEQRKHAVLPWDHPHRLYVSNNWYVTKPRIGAFYTADQRQLLRDIVKGLSSAEGHEKFQRVMKGDNKGFENYSTAVFGNPEENKFVWFLTGRHLTLKCDGDMQEGAVFGGPIFYGHAGDAKDNFNEEPTHPGNVFWSQARLANTLFGALEGKQREKALLKETPDEALATVRLKGDAGPFAGAPCSEMSRDQKALVEELLRSVLAPYRASDVEEAMKVVRDSGGVEKLHLSFYSDEDTGNDKVWDNWMIQGPRIAWFFRGHPHVHTWVNVGTAV